jgi:RNA polymerase sigma-70 factor (ECF subfamily)
VTSLVDYKKLSDEQLMQLAVEDELKAFETLYERLAPTALGIAGRICNDSDRAEDAVQDGFLSVWRARERYNRELGSVHTWIFQIIRFRAIDSMRVYGRDDARRDYGRDVDQTISAPCDLEGTIVDTDQAMRLREALADLPRQQSDVIERAFFRGLTQSQIAQELDLPLGTVKGRMRLGYSVLRRRVAA